MRLLWVLEPSLHIIEIIISAALRTIIKLRPTAMLESSSTFLPTVCVIVFMGYFVCPCKNIVVTTRRVGENWNKCENYFSVLSKNRSLTMRCFSLKMSSAILCCNHCYWVRHFCHSNISYLK